MSSYPCDDAFSARPITPARPLLTLQQFVAKHPAWTLGAIRNLIFYSEARQTSRGPRPANGLSPAVSRLGRKVLIDEAKFFEWLKRQQRQTPVQLELPFEESA